MESYDWSTFLLRIPVHADKQNVFSCWTTQQALESWFLRSAEFTSANGVKKGLQDKIEFQDSYTWMWHGWPDDVTEKGSILHLDNDYLKFSFGKAGNVTVRVKEEVGQTILELLQDEIPVDEASKSYYHIGCTKGWVFYLTNLKSLLEGGIDLRNRDVGLKDVLNS